MLVHTATVRGRRLSWDVREVVQHGMNADRVELSLDDEWLACDRIVAVLAKAGRDPVRVDATGGGYGIPSELLGYTGAMPTCLMGYAGDSVRIVTAADAAPLVVVASGEIAGTDPAPEQPDLWAQLMEEVGRAVEAAEDVKRRADAGEFDGSGLSTGERDPASMEGAKVGDLYINSETGGLFELVEYQEGA